jgi:hypothetical protein
MADQPSYTKGDRVFWWTKEGRAYTSEVSGTYKRYGTVQHVRGKMERLAGPWQDKRIAEISPEDEPHMTTRIGLPFLHKA